jgi:hypothetical protein
LLPFLSECNYLHPRRLKTKRNCIKKKCNLKHDLWLNEYPKQFVASHTENFGRKGYSNSDSEHSGCPLYNAGVL